MPTTIFDNTLALQLDLNRLDANARAVAIKQIDKMIRALTGRLNEGNLTDWNEAKLKKLIAEAKQIIADYYKSISKEAMATANDVGAITAKSTADALSVGGALSVGLPTEPMLAAAASDVMILGAPQKAWWARQSSDALWRFTTAMRQGVMSGETNQQIISRVVQSLGVSRANAASLVQTSIQSVANAAREAVHDMNTDIIKSVMWITALDSHVCPLCAARADKKWDAKTKQPIGHSMPYANPPIHFNDRCVLLPITKTFKELGVDLPEPKAGTRASEMGQVSANLTFDGFLKRQGVAYQNEVLGTGRADMWRAKKMTLSDLVSGNGRPLTLAQLRSKYA